MRAGVVSDIHGSYDHLLLAVAAMGPIDLLIHAGDGWSDLVRWRGEHPGIRVEMVAGNCDLFGGYPADYPLEAVFNLGRWKLFLTHGHLYGAKTDLHRLVLRGREVGADLVVFGHTHRPAKIEWHGLTLFNPGALSRTRCHGRPSYGLIEAGAEGLEIALRYL